MTDQPNILEWLETQIKKKQALLEVQHKLKQEAISIPFEKEALLKVRITESKIEQLNAIRKYYLKYIEDETQS